MKKMDKEEYLKRADEINEAIDKVEKNLSYQFVKTMLDGRGSFEGIRFLDLKNDKVVQLSIYDVIRLAELGDKYEMS